MNRFANPFVRTILAAAAAALGLAACGGGNDEDSSNNGSGPLSITCDTSGYTAGSVAVPTAEQLAKYVGTYNGDEGAYGPNPGDPFVKSASAAFVLGADGSVTYKGTVYTPTSVCLDKAPEALGTLLYLVAGKGHLDVTDKVDAALGSAWGVSPADGTTIFTKGLKK